MGKKPKGQHVEVIARSRPLNHKELGVGDDSLCVVPGGSKGDLDTVKLLVEAGPNAPGIPGPAGEIQTYQFSVDKAFYQDGTNSSIYNYLGGRVLDHAFGGFNVCLLAYGQTGSGKTHTVLGDQADPGLIPRLSEEIFDRIAESDVRTEVLVEMVEIYGKEERMTDLLSDERWGADAVLKLRQRDSTAFYVQGAKHYQPADKEEMARFITAGVNKRTTAETKMNHQSSRSHSILTISVVQHLGGDETLRQGRILLVDLAGSENIDRSGAEGQHANEAIAINTSLTCLRRVLDALAEKQEHVPFRDSVLTKLLADALTGNSMTTIITTMSPAQRNAAESKSTLSYGAQARRIKTKPVVNDSDEKWRVKELEAEVARLKALAAQATPVAPGSPVRVTKTINGMSEAEALAMAERMLEEHKQGQTAREAELEELQLETKARLASMEASMQGHAHELARVAADKAALQEKASAVDEREARLLELEAKLAAREQELAAREDKAAQQEAAALLGCICRGHMLRLEFKRSSQAACGIQAIIRGRMARRLLALARLQAFARGWKVRRDLRNRKTSKVQAMQQKKQQWKAKQSGFKAQLAALNSQEPGTKTYGRATAAVAQSRGAVGPRTGVLRGGRGGAQRRHPSAGSAQPMWLQPQESAALADASDNWQSPTISRELEQLVAQKGGELDAKAAAKRKKSRRRAPGEALAGDFGQLDSIFRGVNEPGRSVSRGSSRGSLGSAGSNAVRLGRSRERPRRRSSPTDEIGSDMSKAGGEGPMPMRSQRRRSEQAYQPRAVSTTPDAAQQYAYGATGGGGGGGGGGVRETRSQSDVGHARRQRGGGNRARSDSLSLPPLGSAGEGMSRPRRKTLGGPSMGRRSVERQERDAVRPSPAASLFDDLFGPSAQVA